MNRARQLAADLFGTAFVATYWWLFFVAWGGM